MKDNFRVLVEQSVPWSVYFSTLEEAREFCKRFECPTVIYQAVYNFVEEHPYYEN